MLKQKIQKTLANGQSVLLAGGPGSGKTYLTNQIIKDYKKNEILKLGPTGLSAHNVDGATIHNFINYGYEETLDNSLTKETIASIASKIKKTKLKLIVIDEIFSTPLQVFKTLDKVFRRIYGSTQFFGGIPVIMNGDPLQYRPVNDKTIMYYEDFFKNTIPFYLKGTKRTEDERLKAIISCVQEKGRIKKDLLEGLNTNDASVCYNEDTINIVATNTQRGEINNKIYGNKPGVIKIRSIEYSEVEKEDGTTERQETEVLEVLYPGQEALIRINEQQGSNREYNGHKVTIKDFLFIRSDDNRYKYEIAINYKAEDYESHVNILNVQEDENGELFIEHNKDEEYRFPIIGAKTITSHLVQGQTITSNIGIHLGTGSPSSMFVALSRSTNLDKIVYANYGDSALKISNDQYKAFAYLREKSGQEISYAEYHTTGDQRHTVSLYEDGGTRTYYDELAIKKNLEYIPSWFKEFKTRTGYQVLGNESELDYFKSSVHLNIENYGDKEEDEWTTDNYWIPYMPIETNRFDRLIKKSMREATRKRAYTSLNLAKAKNNRISNGASNMVAIQTIIIDLDEVVGNGRTTKEFVDMFLALVEDRPELKPNAITVSGSSGCHLKFKLEFPFIIDTSLRGGTNKEWSKPEVANNQAFILANKLKSAIEQIYWEWNGLDRKNQNHQGINQQTTVNGSLTKKGEEYRTKIKDFTDLEGSRTITLSTGKLEPMTLEDMALLIGEEDALEEEKTISEIFESSTRAELLTNDVFSTESLRKFMAKSVNTPTISEKQIQGLTKVLAEVDYIGSKVVFTKLLKNHIGLMNTMGWSRSKKIKTITHILNMAEGTLSNKNTDVRIREKWTSFCNDMKKAAGKKKIKEFKTTTTPKSIKKNHYFYYGENLSAEERVEKALEDKSDWQTDDEAIRDLYKSVTTQKSREKTNNLLVILKEKYTDEEITNLLSSPEELSKLRNILKGTGLLSKEEEKRTKNFNKKVQSAMFMNEFIYQLNIDVETFKKNGPVKEMKKSKKFKEEIAGLFVEDRNNLESLITGIVDLSKGKERNYNRIRQEFKRNNNLITKLNDHCSKYGIDVNEIYEFINNNAGEVSREKRDTTVKNDPAKALARANELFLRGELVILGTVEEKEAFIKWAEGLIKTIGSKDKELTDKLKKEIKILKKSKSEKKTYEELTKLNNELLSLVNIKWIGSYNRHPDDEINLELKKIKDSYLRDSGPKNRQMQEKSA